MTAQIQDTVIYENQEYVLCGINGGPLPMPQNYGLTPVGHCTACWRGHQMTYVVEGGALLLLHMHVYDAEDAYPQIEGVAVSKRGGIVQMPVYRDLRLPTEFSGQLLIADKLIHYVHMGFHKPYAYEEVHELFLDHGMILKIIDRSDKMAAIRERIKRHREESAPEGTPDRQTMADWINFMFSRDYPDLGD